MAFEIKGFRSRRKAARAAQSGEVVTTALGVEEISFAQKISHFFHENPKIIRNSILGAAAVAVIVITFLVLRAGAREEHSRKLHEALEKYDQIKILPRGDARSLQLKEFGLSLKPVCEQGLKTIESSAACFTAGTALLEGREFAAAASLFERAAAGYDTEAMQSIARFMQAQALESAREFEKALAVYKTLEKEYAYVKKADLAIFHEGRMLYYLGRYDEAEERFGKLTHEGEGKDFALQSRSYISLLNAERAQQGNQPKK